jgi:hypothetical protein
MRLRGTVAVLTLGAVLAAGCNGNGNGGPDPDDAAGTTTSVPVPQDPVETPCLSENPGFSTRGTVSIPGGSRPDAARLSAVDWEITPECERIVFAFLTDRSAPASSVGLSRIEFFPDQAILRVAMPRDVDITAVADVLVDGALITRAFVVRSRSGELSVDLHMSPSIHVEARGFIATSPARLVVDLRPAAGVPPPATSLPTVSDSIVVLSPPPGAADYPVRIRGYARTLDDVVTARVERTTTVKRITAAPSADAWGEFAVTISEGEGPSGEFSLVVEAGEAGTGDSVEIPLILP